MGRSILRGGIGGLAVACAVSWSPLYAQDGSAYRVARAEDLKPLAASFTESQLALLEKLNRADVGHLERQAELAVPSSWNADELAYSVLPMRYSSSQQSPKLLIVYLPGQLFGAYEFGGLVRWGPISSGGRRNPTEAGLFALNWRSPGRASTVDSDWFMRWYFNFGNREGLALHAYALPGLPASHGCIRLLDRDARWLFEWGEPWVLDPGGTRVLTPGTPVFIVGRYDFDAAPPWRSIQWLSQPVELPALPVTGTDTR